MIREEALKLALESKKETLRQKTAAREAKIAALAKNNAEYLECGRAVSALGAKLASVALSGNSADLEKLKTELEKLYKKRESIIEAAGIGPIEYECEKCADTGYVNGALCECVTAAAGKLMLEDLANGSQSKNCTFENFDLSFYTDEQAKKRMKAVFELAKKYAAGFSGSTRENLLFMGNTGLGKTHLSLAIANEVIKKGYGVIYSPAYNLFGEIEAEHFSKHTNKTYENAVNCDLLIIDDLGGEFVSPYIESVAYNVINTRINNGKPTIINTNLGMARISEIYTPRVASRFIGDYTAKAFLGSDIRQLKNQK